MSIPTFRPGLLSLSLLVAVTSLPSPVVADTGGDVPDAAHDCLIEPHVLTDVGSPGQGIVARLLVDRGVEVVRGQPIAELESSIERAVLQLAEARAGMESEVVTREADLTLARLDEKRFDSLYVDRLAPAQQRDEAVARQQVATAALVQALENRLIQQLELQRARRTFEQRTIRSPVDGVVVRRLVSAGELVHDNPLMTVAGLDPLRVEVVLPARLFGTVAPGDPARIFPEVARDEPLLASVEVVDPLLDARSGTFGVRLSLANADRAVPAGQKCRLSFLPPDADAPLAPATGGGRQDEADRGESPAVLGAAAPGRSGDAPR